MSSSKRTRAALRARFKIAGRGGKRPGAGRKPKGERALVSHIARPILTTRFPVSVTLTLCAGLPSLRRAATRVLLERALAGGARRDGFQVTHHSIRPNHLHLVCASRDRRRLSRGMQGLGVRIARSLNRHWDRKGTVFADRFRARIPRSHREARDALAFVLHGACAHDMSCTGVDSFASEAAAAG